MEFMNCFSIQNKEDLQEVWNNVQKVYFGVMTYGVKELRQSKEALAAKRSEVNKQEHI